MSKMKYLCPGCLFFEKQTILENGLVLHCPECVLLIDDNKINVLRKVFSTHSKQGYRCIDCNRFIPDPIDNSEKLFCPYLDCCFVGSKLLCHKMRHPTVKNNELEKQSKIEINNSEIKNDSFIDKRIDLLKDVINSQLSNVFYNSSEFTIKQKISCYQAFLKILDKYPLEMLDYMLDSSRSGGFQHILFQEYISIFEKCLPYSFKKNGKLYKVESLLDEQLSLFDGISVFEEIIDSNLEIKNSTNELYIGGRKASYIKPFYIGKLLEVLDKKTKRNLIDKVDEYSFSKIKMKDIDPNRSVIVTHLRIPPHYQMGGMTYVNRLRKMIVDQARAVLED
jgi:DNA-directed RNA polymerase subunit RPC12/RpoP